MVNEGRISVDIEDLFAFLKCKVRHINLSVLWYWVFLHRNTLRLASVFFVVLERVFTDLYLILCWTRNLNRGLLLWHCSAAAFELEWRRRSGFHYESLFWLTSENNLSWRLTLKTSGQVLGLTITAVLRPFCYSLEWRTCWFISHLLQILVSDCHLLQWSILNLMLSDASTCHKKWSVWLIPCARNAPVQAALKLTTYLNTLRLTIWVIWQLICKYSILCRLL